MSNYPLPQNSNESLTPDLAALAKIGKVFQWIYLLFISVIGIGIAYIGALFLAMIVLHIIDSGTLEEIMFTSIKLLALTGLGIVALCLIIVTILMLIRIWATPKSLVPGSGIGKAYVISCIVNFFVGIGLGILLLLEPELTIISFSLSGVLTVISLILMLIYVWQLAAAVDSKPVKSYITWYVVGIIGNLLCHGIVMLTNGPFPSFDELENNMFLLVMECLVAGFGLVAFISFLDIFKYTAKDVAAFVKNHSKPLFKGISQQKIQQETN